MKLPGWRGLPPGSRREDIEQLIAARGKEARPEKADILAQESIDGTDRSHSARRCR
jgi:hypothetical protein